MIFPLIVAIDLQPMAPIEGVIQVQGDISNARTAEVRHLQFVKIILLLTDSIPKIYMSPGEGGDIRLQQWLVGRAKPGVPFLACGDLRGYDSDRSYPLPKAADGTYQSLAPVQPPIAPPYKRALEMKKASHGIRELEKLSLDS